jgi:hypothetical protein
MRSPTNCPLCLGWQSSILIASIRPSETSHGVKRWRSGKAEASLGAAGSMQAQLVAPGTRRRAGKASLGSLTPGGRQFFRDRMSEITVVSAHASLVLRPRHSSALALRPPTGRVSPRIKRLRTRPPPRCPTGGFVEVEASRRSESGYVLKIWYRG